MSDIGWAMSDLRALLLRHEGERYRPYMDCCGKPFRLCTCATQGHLTIGIGHNLEAEDLPDPIVHAILDHDIDDKSRELRAAFPWTANLDAVRGAALLDMAFNFGVADLQKFPKFMGAMFEHDWTRAVSELTTIHFASAGRRADIAQMILTGQEGEGGEA